MCEWDTAKFLIFSSNGIPLIYYSHITTIIIFTGLFFLTFRNLKNFPKMPFRLMAISYIIWLFCDLVLWANEIIPHVMFFWTIINLIEPLIFLFAFVFFLSLIEQRKLYLKEKWILFALILPTLFMAPLGLSTVGFDYTTCDRNVVEGIAAYYNYFLEGLFLFLIILKTIISLFSKKFKDQRAKIGMVSFGVSFLLLSFLTANFLGTFLVDYDISQYGHIAVPIFAIFLAYIAIKFESVEPRILVIDTLVTSVIILIISLFFAEDENYRRFITGLTLILSLPMAYSLVKNIRKEVSSRKKIENLAHELEKSNLSLADANEKLKGLDKLKTEFLSLASHQLRSPLTAIKGYASMLDEGSLGKLTKEQDTAAKRIYASAQGLVNLVEDLLNVSKIEQGGMKFEFMQVELAKQVQELAGEMRIPAENKKLVLTVSIPEGDSFVTTADPVKIKQVFLNIVDNSIKYTPSGSVTVGLARDNKNNIVFTVKDTGVGISPETRASLFEKFSRGEAGKLNTGGSGLGLYLASQIVKAHNGTIDVQSEGVNKGTTFIVTLPSA